MSDGSKEGGIKIEKLDEDYDSSGTGASFDAIVQKFTELISLMVKQLLSEEFGDTVAKIKRGAKYFKLAAILVVLGVLLLGLFMVVWFFVGITYIATNTPLPGAVAPFLVGIIFGVVLTVIYKVLS